MELLTCVLVILFPTIKVVNSFHDLSFFLFFLVIFFSKVVCTINDFLNMLAMLSKLFTSFLQDQFAGYWGK